MFRFPQAENFTRVRTAPLPTRQQPCGGPFVSVRRGGKACKLFDTNIPASSEAGMFIFAVDIAARRG